VLQERGFGAAHELFWNELASALVVDKVDILYGDFNMALWRVIPELTERGLQVSMLAFYPWACTRGGGATIVECADENNPEDARAACHDEVRFDSCGIFAISPCAGIDRAYGQEDLQDPARLDKYQTGQGYPARSYVGQQTSVDKSLRSVHVGGEPQHRLPKCTQKKIKGDMWDPAQLLWTRGGHMPLLVYVGENPYRRDASLVRREGGHIRRGWGPSSRNRTWHMQRAGASTEQQSSEQTAAGADQEPAVSAQSEGGAWGGAWGWTPEHWSGSASSSSGWWRR